MNKRNQNESERTVTLFQLAYYSIERGMSGMKILVSSVTALLKVSLIRWSSLYPMVMNSHSPKALKAEDAPIPGMDIWSSVRLQPELFGAGAFFGLGCEGGMQIHNGNLHASKA